MNAHSRTASSAAPASARIPMLTVLRGLMLTEAAGGLVVTIFLSMLAAGVGDSGASGPDETTIRFAAGATFLFAIFAAVASRGTRRRRPWAWTMAAILQVLLAIGTGAAVLLARWEPVMLIGFGLPVLVMLVLSAASTRRALGQA